ncbi:MULTISPECIES: hypothetical protein [unclassified Haematospirillum]|uniref:hypothetical protein n=1 Tax=unclassified Haematospirillum TaxID=2622088 RepID=UPI00143BB3D6|nr:MULTISPECIES: hypothetical protein [unclassified Haematospirillum]NKD55133.1 hypothetical protein [Haematospirillum sp. H4890]NKD75386.1 hypothetical protein [Haematospirillum sp. H4485]NKD87661.1 hypothetical protein [Haematospirillum sp. 15-248]
MGLALVMCLGSGVHPANGRRLARTVRLDGVEQLGHGLGCAGLENAVLVQEHDVLMGVSHYGDEATTGAGDDSGINGRVHVLLVLGLDGDGAKVVVVESGLLGDRGLVVSVDRALKLADGLVHLLEMEDDIRQGQRGDVPVGVPGYALMPDNKRPPLSRGLPGLLLVPFHGFVGVIDLGSQVAVGDVLRH